ncbi:MAG TPA: hypothetical protein VIM84_00865 [Gemmatimonadales bacterium]
MSDLSRRTLSSKNAEPIASLSDRVAERVRNARLAIESQPNAGRASPTRHDPDSTAEQREVQSLKRVFGDMGRAYRRYRSQTGGPVVPGLRDANLSFRENPSLPGLITVAAFLDDLDLLS